MSYLISSIILGIYHFPFYAVALTLPIIVIPILRYKKFNFMRISLNYAFLFYSLCMISLVYFPLPSADQIASLNTHEIQLVPFHFISDIIRETPLNISNPHTYLPALFHETILQVVFNVLMLLPFGMFLRYYCGLNAKKVLLFSFLLSLFIEIGQLTGLFFLYPGSYRLCDVDDLMANTLGGYLGYKLISAVELHIPCIKAFDRPIPSFKKLPILKF